MNESVSIVVEICLAVGRPVVQYSCPYDDKVGAPKLTSALLVEGFQFLVRSEFSARLFCLCSH